MPRLHKSILLSSPEEELEDVDPTDEMEVFLVGVTMVTDLVGLSSSADFLEQTLLARLRKPPTSKSLLLLPFKTSGATNVG